MAQHIIPIRFRFIRLPVTWAVFEGERLEKLGDAQLKEIEKKRGRALAPDIRKYLGEPFSTGPILWGEIRQTDSPYEEDITEIDGWHWRDEFFRLPHKDINALTGFLNEVGAWPLRDMSTQTPGLSLHNPIFLRPDDIADIWRFRNELMLALLGPNRVDFKEQIAPPRGKTKNHLDLVLPEVQPNSFHLRLELSSTVEGVVTVTNARHMLFTTVLADVARGIRFKTCQRKDCQRPFALESKHKKKFCSQYCGHLVSLRKKRKRAKKPKLQPSNPG